MKGLIIRGLLGLTMLVAAIPTGSAAQTGDGAQTSPERQGWIGITFREESGGQAIVVEEVMPDAPARTAGIVVGDRIVSWNGRADVAEAIRTGTLRPGDEIRVSVSQADGQEDRQVTIIAAERPAMLASRQGPGPRDILEFRRVGPRAQAFRLDRDSLENRLDALNAELRLLLRDNYGPVLSLEGGRGVVIDGDTIRIPGPGNAIRMRVLEDSLASRFLGPAADVFVVGRRAVAGAELVDITPGLASYFGTDAGVLVVRVAPETPAARAGLRDGDVIVAAEGQEVSDVAELRWALSRPATREFALEVLRERQRLTLTLGR